MFPKSEETCDKQERAQGAEEHQGADLGGPVFQRHRPSSLRIFLAQYTLLFITVRAPGVGGYSVAAVLRDQFAQLTFLI